jgi:hypothetical protein
MIRVAVLSLAVAFALSSADARAEGTADAPKPKAASKASKKKKAPKVKEDSEAAADTKLTRNKAGRLIRGQAMRVTADRLIGDSQVIPFPSHAGAAKKALAANRRDQLDDAEHAARAQYTQAAQNTDDRWGTVLFHLRSLDSRNDAEACFWRVLAYYRLGEIARARRIRELCELPAKDQSLLDTEDATAGSLQPPQLLPEFVAAGERPPELVVNPAPYGGPAPSIKN